MLLEPTQILLPPSPLSNTQIRLLKTDATLMTEQIKNNLLSSKTDDDSLIRGNLGLLIYHFALYNAFGDEIHAYKGLDILYDVFVRINNNQTMTHNYAYASGICGLSRCLDFLIGEDILPTDMIEEAAAFDDALFEQAKTMIMHKRNDFLHSSLGILAYFTNKSSDKVSCEKIEQLLTLLLESVNETEEHCWLDNIFKDKQDEALINLSLSHGQCSFLLILLDLYKKGFRQTRLSQVITKGINYIVSTYREIGSEPGNYSVFPSMTNPAENKYVFGNRLGWCYGDLNKVYLLYKAGKILNEPRYTAIADIVGTSSTTRTTFEHTLCNDSNFCHGSSGLAQFYHTLHQLHPMDAYLNSYYFWLRQTIQFLEKEIADNYYKRKETQLLEGLLGPALVLLSFSKEKSFSWPRLFLLETHITPTN